MRELPSRDVRQRVEGRPELEKRIRAVLVAVHRFGRCRAATDADRGWTARMIDTLTDAITTAEEPRP
jgi:hypothetical protein